MAVINISVINYSVIPDVSENGKNYEVSHQLFSAITPEIFLNLVIEEKNNKVVQQYFIFVKGHLKCFTIYTLLQALVANERLCLSG